MRNLRVAGGCQSLRESPKTSQFGGRILGVFPRNIENSVGLARFGKVLANCLTSTPPHPAMNHTTPAVSPQGLACHAPAFEVTSAIPTGTEAAECDIAHKFVRVKEVRADGLVCFEFAIGWPELFVDLMLPQAAFDEFCSRQQVQRLTD